MCGYFCIEFIDFLLKGKSLSDYKNFFSPNGYKNNDKIILTKKMENLYCSFICRKYRNLENLKHHTSLEKNLSFLLFAVSERMKMKKYLKKKIQLTY